MVYPDQASFTNATNQFMRHCGITMTFVTPQGAEAQLEIADYCRNTGLSVHGGLLYTMADCVVSAYARDRLAAPVTLSADFHYLANVTAGTLTARATPIRVGKSMAVVDGEVRQGDLILAKGTFTCYSPKK